MFIQRARWEERLIDYHALLGEKARTTHHHQTYISNSLLRCSQSEIPRTDLRWIQDVFFLCENCVLTEPAVWYEGMRKYRGEKEQQCNIINQAECILLGYRDTSSTSSHCNAIIYYQTLHQKKKLMLIPWSQYRRALSICVCYLQQYCHIYDFLLQEEYWQ